MNLSTLKFIVVIVGLHCYTRLFETIIYYFFDQMSYFTTQEVGNPMQIIKYVELPRFQPILKH